MKKVVHTPAAPAALGPYSQAIVANGMVYLSGQIALIPETGLLVGEDVEVQTKQVMENLKAVLDAAGSSFSQVVKTSIFLKNMDDFSKVNAIYGTYFTQDPPARETVEVARLPKEVKVEISMIALV
jgi:2-iminobutanoate/2-iminopropanoate deaminase